MKVGENTYKITEMNDKETINEIKSMSQFYECLLLQMFLSLRNNDQRFKNQDNSHPIHFKTEPEMFYKLQWPHSF